MRERIEIDRIRPYSQLGQPLCENNRMLVHIVCWKYKPQTDAQTRRDHIEQLRRLPSLINGIESFEVGADILHLDRSFDTGLVAKFAGPDELDAYTVNPEHQRVAALGREISEKTVSVDFIRVE